MARGLSQLFTTLRGSIGGVTFTKNGFQPIVLKARVAPVNPRTVNQELMRSCLSGAEQLWKNLTQADRNLWEDYAATLVYNGPTGAYSVPGRQVCIGNVSLALYAEARGLTVAAITAAPPIITGFVDIEAVQPASGPNPGTGFGISAGYNGTENILLLGSESGSVSLTRKRYSGPFRGDSLIEAAIAPPAVGILEFTTANPDTNHFGRVRAMTAQPPFRLSAEYIIQATSATLP